MILNAATPLPSQGWVPWEGHKGTKQSDDILATDLVLMLAWKENTLPAQRRPTGEVTDAFCQTHTSRPSSSPFDKNLQRMLTPQHKEKWKKRGCSDPVSPVSIIKRGAKGKELRWIKQ